MLSGFGSKKGGMNRQSTVDFQGNEAILYNIIIVDTCPRVMPSNAEGTCSIPGQVAKGSNMARSQKAKT